jgi:hypothetical protein
MVAMLDRRAPFGVEPGALHELELADELIRRRREIDRLEAEFATLAWAGHRRGIGAIDGSPSTQAWLRRHTGMREGEARTAIETGSACELLPRIGAAWREGDITSGAVRTITAARTDGHDPKLVALEDLLLGLARADDQRELRRACEHFRDCARADGTEPREHDGLTLSKTYGNRTMLQAELSSTAAETVCTAIHELTDPPSDADPRTPARRRADALVRMAELALANLRAAGDTGPVRARPAASIVVDWTTLTGEQWGRLDGQFVGTLHRADVERMLCDCTISRVVTGPDGLPLEVGRSQRTPSPAQRRALHTRDGGCRFPGCQRPPGWTDAHHVVHWKDGGRTDLDNLVSLCDHHHHVVHQPGWTVEFDGHTLSTRRPDGTAIT